MVRAILEGRKTVTRRVVKPANAVDIVTFIGADNHPTGEFGWCPHPSLITKHIRPPYMVGDRMYVREKTLREHHPAEIGLTREDLPHTWDMACAGAGAIHYAADLTGNEAIIVASGRRWTPSIHMPKAWARIWLEVTAVRVERLQDISEDQARAEGVTWSDGKPDRHGLATELVVSAKSEFEILWDQINGAGAWAANPWVWVVEFKRLEEAS